MHTDSFELKAMRKSHRIDPQVLSLILDTRELALKVDDIAIARGLTEMAIAVEAAMFAGRSAALRYHDMAH